MNTFSLHPDQGEMQLNPAGVRPGMTFGNWEVLSVKVHKRTERIHGLNCHCCWNFHRNMTPRRGEILSTPDCSYDNPECPCYRVETWYEYTVICRCAHAVVTNAKSKRQDWPVPPPVIREVSVWALLSGQSRSCGHCRCDPETCARPWLFEAA